MTAETVFYIIVAILSFDFLLGLFLDYLNKTRWSSTLPERLRGIYSEDKYNKQQNYEKVNHRFGNISGAFSFLLVMAMLFFNGFALVDGWAHELSENSILIALVFFGILMFASDLINLPFSVYSIFVIEERFGFNKTTPGTFILDKLKGWLIAAVLGGGILSLIIWFYELTAGYFWLYAWGAVSVFMVFMAMFYSNLIVPLFNKQKPLEEGELRDEIRAFADKAGFRLDNIFTIDGSKRSTRANAYFTGLGKKKRIVLYDTLIADLSKEEIVAVLAHEVGHYKKKHTTVGLVVSLIQTGVMLYLLSLFIDSPLLSEALGIDTPSFHIGAMVFGILYSPVSMILGLIMNTVSRKNEYEADRFAAEHYNAEYLGNALKKLSVNNLSNLTPHPAYVFFNYSHPTLLQRLESLGL